MMPEEVAVAENRAKAVLYRLVGNQIKQRLIA
jgi:hypothetical protein